MHHRLLWITDLHLEFQPRESYAWLAKAIKSSRASALLLTGDIMPSWQLPAALVKLVESVGVPVYFVIGNHDYYGWSIAETETAVDQAVYAVKKSKRALIWLDRQDGPIPLDTRTTLVGTGGWGDFSVLEGYGYAELNDEFEIKELLSLRGPTLAQYHQQLAHQSAEKFRPKLEAALETSSQVIIGTHVSPFRGSTWHEGNYLRTGFSKQVLQCNSRSGD